MPETIQHFNERAIALRAQGRLREAVAVFSEAIVRYPDAAVLYNNLGMTLDELGAPKEALMAYDSALTRAPRFVAALIGKAGLLLRDGHVDEARTLFEEALAIDPEAPAAHLGMYELLQIKGELNAAVAHQRRVLERNRLFSYRAPDERRSVLVLCMPGDWQANVPVDFIFDRKTTSVHKLFLLDAQRMQAELLPPYDVVFNAIAESDEAVETLELARAFINSQPRAALNAPERVLSVGRRRLAKTLAGVDCTVPPIEEISAQRLLSEPLPFDFPVIVRPVGSHAGHHLARIDDSSSLEPYETATHAPRYFVSPFVDYSSSDGLFRKYRIVYVDGIPYPVHLAISSQWMVHYYNAPMRDHAWMRDEEAAFLADLGSAFGGRSGEAVGEVPRKIGLEYFGIDCTIGRDGRLLIFEADPAMLVHTTDPVELYPYKHEYVPRIYRAVEAMIDGRKVHADT